MTDRPPPSDQGPSPAILGRSAVLGACVLTGPEAAPVAPPAQTIAGFKATAGDEPREPSPRGAETSR